MFWGLIVQPNKKYSKTVSMPFHVSQAVLDVSTATGDGDVQLILKSDQVDYILCSLNKTGRVQTQLDLNFSEGDEISFRSVGGTVHLTGYLDNEQNFPEYEEGSSDEEEAPMLVDASKQKGKRSATQEESSGDDSDDEVGSDGGEDVDDEASDDSDNEAIEGSDDDDSDAEQQQPPPKVSKLNNGMANGVSKKEDKSKEKRKENKQKTKTDSDVKQPTNVGGVTIQDIREGKGAEVRNGRKVQVYYEGRFQTNNKIFDKANAGKGFEFIVGRGSVIRGWDVGVLGMKVGGKRRVICPPNMAYGKKGSPPAIPPNATLVFDIELRNVL